MQIVEQLTVEFGLIKPYPETIIQYEGDDDSGVVVIINALGNASGVQVNRTTGGEFLRVNSTKLTAITGGDIQEYDQIVIDTRKGQKSAFLSREGVDYNILHAIESSANWIRLERGQNKFTFNAISGIDNLRIYVECTDRFNGV